MSVRTRSAMTLRNLVRLFMQRTADFLQHDLQLIKRLQPVGQIARVDEVALKDVVAVVKLAGGLPATIILSFDDSLAQEIVRGYLPDGTPDKELDSLFNDTMAEVANVIVANSIMKFPREFDQVTVSLPKALRQQNVKLRNMGDDLWTAEATTSHGNFNISLQV